MLVEKMMEPFCLVELIREEDGAGGFYDTWIEHIEFKAVATIDTSLEAAIADKPENKTAYTITTHRNAMLKYDDHIRRLSDGRIFRITSNGDDMKSPAFSGLDLCQVKAERWDLT